MDDKERELYCKDCDRSIYGKYHDCDINIENNGKVPYSTASLSMAVAKLLIAKERELHAGN